MAKSIFVSYNFNDREVTEAVRHLINDHEEDIHGKIVFVENDVSYNGATAINWEIEHVMENCDAALFVMGEDHHNSPWLSKECEHALEKDIPIMITSLPGEDFHRPDCLNEQNCQVLGWETNELYSCMNQA